MHMKRYTPLVFGLCGLLVLGLVIRSQGQPARHHPQSAKTAATKRSDRVAEAPQPRATSEASGARRLSMIAVGDIMTDRNVDKAIRANGVHSILAKVQELTRSGDISFANLESPLSTVGAHSPSDCVFRARPESVQVLLDGGFDVVSLANNHTFNAGREGLLQTYATLEKAGIQYCGAARDKRGDHAAILTAGTGPLKVGFLGATDMSIGHGSYNKVSADRSNLIAQIQGARSYCDLLVVTFHWGDEYMPMPNQRQRNTAHAAIKAGADIVLGHHPHTLEGIEVFQGKPILYSMGNFVFDQREGERMESAIFKIDYAEGWGWQIMAKPIWIPRSRMGPIYPETARRDKILARLAKISKPLGTTLQIRDGKAWLRIPATATGATKGSNS